MEKNSTDAGDTANINDQISGGVDDFINSMEVPVEDTGFDASAAFGTIGDEEDQPGEGASTENDFDLSDEQTAVALWELFDRGQAFVCAVIANEPMDRFQKITDSSPPSKRSINVTASLVKKYSLGVSLETQLLMIIVALYGPNVFAATQLRSQKAKEKKAQKKKNGQEES